MSYRLLGNKRFSKHNFIRLTSCKKDWSSIGAYGLATHPGDGCRSYALFCVNNLATAEQKINTSKCLVGSGFSSTIFTTNRPQSTIQASSPLVLKDQLSKKRKNHYKIKFAELIQMNHSGSLSNSKTAVQKLKNKRLTDFINDVAATIPDPVHFNTSEAKSSKAKNPAIMRGKPNSLIDVNRDKIFQQYQQSDDEPPLLFVGRRAPKIRKDSPLLQEIFNSYMTFKELSIDSDLQHDDCLGLVESQQNTSNESKLPSPFIVEDIVPTVPIQKKTPSTATDQKQDRLIAKHHKSVEHEQLGRQKALFHNLSVYLDVCVNNDMITRGLNTLLNYRMRCKKVEYRLNVMNIELYNVLLSGYAAKGNVEKVRYLMTILKEDAISANHQTYAAVLECMMRAKMDAKTSDESNRIKKQMNEYRMEASAKGITINDIISKSQFVRDQRRILLNALRLLEPNFIPVYQPPATYYENVLLNELNNDVLPLSNATPIQTRHLDNNRTADFTIDQVDAMSKEQLRIEMDTIITIKSVEKFAEPTETVLFYRKQLAELHEHWRSQIMDAFQRDLNTVRSHTHSKGNRAISLFPYLRALSADNFADILLNEAKTISEGSESFSLTTSQLHNRIGRLVQTKYYMERKRSNGVVDKTRHLYKDFCGYVSDVSSTDNPRQRWQRLVFHAENQGPSMDIVDQQWPVAVVTGIGRFLYQILMRDLKVDGNAIRANSKSKNILPAFYALFRNEGKFVKEEVKPHPVLAKLVRGSQQQTLRFDSKTVPMLCPPVPWRTPQNGGYLLARSDLIRLPNQAHQQLESIQEVNPVDIYPSLDSLNQLSSIAWKVNQTILDIILEVFNNGGSKKLNVPQPSSALQPLEELDPKSEKAADMSKTDRYNYFRLKLLHRRKQQEMHSLWCDTLYRLSLANHYRDKVFWLPHNMDFRGRVYPIPPHLNHLGADLGRCLLVFNKSKPLGPDGFAWLKLHCINLTGFKKKKSVAERLLYADEIMDDILDSADNPLTGRLWWASSDEPWQTLAACIEIARAHRSPDPTEYISSFPIHQDGSCNGLQHYAALGRDTTGAISVNLVPCDVPQDVYSDVANLVEEARRSDAEDGLEVAKVLEGFIKRSVIKQTVMTNVYGVTRFGARAQISRQLKDIDNFPKEWIWSAATYLTNKTFDSLREMFTSTREIQDWFTQCARLIASIGGHNVAWTTPLGFPIVQPYNRYDSPQQHRSTNRVAVNMIMDTHTKPNVMKQKNAFPPNFIHSLDSSHMMLTSLHCDKIGLTFMSVHDCYWTHACTVPTMNRICRQQFVALHSQPILEDLSRQLIDKYSYSGSDFTNDGSVMDSTKHKLNRTLLQMPEKGDFDLKNVLQSVYFFS